jgi:hypothetical protein
MRFFATRLFSVLLFTISGCSILTGQGTPPPSSFLSHDGLERVEIDLPGVLELREDHGIGRYDAVTIPNARLRYKRGSLRMTRMARQIFLTLLTDTLVDASTDATLPIESEPGPCVMEINLEVVGMNLEVDDDPLRLADMTVVMQFFDSASQEPLLRYAVPHRIPNPNAGNTPDDQLKKGLRRIVDELNLAASLRGAGLADENFEPGCNGTLAALGRAAEAGR